MRKYKKIRKELEYEDAPSGYVTLYNYKEPFMPFRQGYGYEGCLLFDGTTDKIQCHYCGEWFEQLQHHLHGEHNMSTSEYKLAVGLSKTTALISEKFREKLISAGQSRFKNLKNRKGLTPSKETREKIRQTLKDRRREYQNIQGCCPLQLIDRLQKKSIELGRCPTSKEITYEDTLAKVFGSFSEACKRAGLTPLKPGQTLTKSKYTLEYLISLGRKFYQDNKRLPNSKDMNRAAWAKYAKQRKLIEGRILYGEKAYQKTGRRLHLSKEDLLETIKLFYKNNNRYPSVSDCRRGLLPHASRYYYHFGSLAKAVKQAQHEHK